MKLDTTACLAPCMAPHCHEDLSTDLSSLAYKVSFPLETPESNHTEALGTG